MVKHFKWSALPKSGWSRSARFAFRKKRRRSWIGQRSSAHLGQFELVDRLEDEIEAVGRELSRAVGLGGRDRPVASAAERARINITRAIKVALERIAEHNPALATLLTSSIRTGTFCSYTTDTCVLAALALQFRLGPRATLS